MLEIVPVTLAIEASANSNRFSVGISVLPFPRCIHDTPPAAILGEHGRANPFTPHVASKISLAFEHEESFQDLPLSLESEIRGLVEEGSEARVSN